jgi:hypothetical protein
MGGPQSRSQHCGEEKIIMPPPAIKPRPSSLSLYNISYPDFIDQDMHNYNFARCMYVVKCGLSGRLRSLTELVLKIFGHEKGELQNAAESYTVRSDHLIVLG